MDTNKIEDNKIKRERSSSYPSVSLKDAINGIEELSGGLGSGPYSREAAAQALGYKGVSGASATKIASLAHFGLLNKEGNAYRQSDLSKRILAPKTEEDKQSAISEALRAPKLYAKLFDKYAGKGLPTLLNNILYHDFGITLSSSKEAAEVFRQSAEFAGFLKNGVLLNPGDLSTAEALSEDQNSDSSSNNDMSMVKATRKDTGQFPVRLPSGITVLFPQDLSFNFGLGQFAEPLRQMEDIAKTINDGQV